MTIETDLDTLKAEWTPKQLENWEAHGETLFENLERLPAVIEENGGTAEVDVAAAKEWYLRTYRPKMRGDGMMKRDHVKIGSAEYYMTKFMSKLGNAWSSIEGMVMASFGVSSDDQEAAEDAATAIFLARNLNNPRGIAHAMQEHQKVGKLYGLQ